MTSQLFSPFHSAHLDLPHRVVMAPLTRNRAVGQVPNDLMVDYYRQRANPASGAALIVSEGTPIGPMAHGYLDTPGIYTPEQVAGWRRVTDAVHAEGGRIVAQIWHVGRISHTSLLPGGAQPVSSTAQAARSKTYIAGGFADVSAPRALGVQEIAGIVADYAHAARCAVQAGFDGVEIHAANGYLVEQFLRDRINDRDDAYGGPITHRLRFLAEVMQAVTGAIGAGRTAIRLSPVTPANDAALDSDPQALFNAVGDMLGELGLLYVHVVEGQTGGARDYAPFDYAQLRRRCRSTWMVNNGYSAEMAEAAIAEGRADLVAFGRPFISNPDLSLRLRQGHPLAPLQRETLYGGGAAGYTDYPVWSPTTENC
ncbi:MAG: alkene reductase [Leptothrix sp. (in: Bacteria)]|nr:alkene reductase [Leptothrix sp. (in: b-proteobacteria)]